MASAALPPDSTSCGPRVENGSQKLAWTRWSTTSFGTVGAGALVGVIVMGSLGRVIRRGSISSRSTYPYPRPAATTMPNSIARGRGRVRGPAGRGSDAQDLDRRAEEGLGGVFRDGPE